MANALAHETSPYLLQHQDNPVAWQPWGDAAFAEARATGKPILLSVGYAACHWCHVMAHESFENEPTARLMNDLYVNIKVDREERPDVDAIYQRALQMMGEQGGWPLTMFLTPHGEPFWGGTYFPPTGRHGRPAFADVLDGVAQAYREQPERIRHNADTLRQALAELAESRRGGGPTLDWIDDAARQLAGAVDVVNGGLPGAPKFPQPSLFRFLWHAGRRSGGDNLGNAVLLTLDRMCNGGIYDHLGGGFARYATDDHWLVPHFEKMLYDNAQLIELLGLAWQGTRRRLYAERVAETIGWLAREMMAEGGAFAASLDADSEGEEGRFYVWSMDELDRVLPAGDRESFKAAYDCRPGGNWDGHIILNRNLPQPEAGDAFEARLARCRGLLLAARAKRTRPGRDDKILADWNGMMIAALADAAFTFDRPDWLGLARHAFDAVVARLSRDDGRLGHCYRNGRLQPAAMLDDYAQMARAALHLHETTGEPGYLEQARRWVAVADAHYWDDAGGGYFFTADDAADLLVRSKLIFDNAVPSGNGVMVEVLIRLWHHSGDDAYRRRADGLVGAFAGALTQSFPNMTALLDGVLLAEDPLAVVLVGAPADRRRLERVVAETALPPRLLTLLAPDAALPPGHPASPKLDRGRLGAFVCRGPVCAPPVAEPEALRNLLVRR